MFFCICVKIALIIDPGSLSGIILPSFFNVLINNLANLGARNVQLVHLVRRQTVWAQKTVLFVKKVFNIDILQFYE